MQTIAVRYETTIKKTEHGLEIRQCCYPDTDMVILIPTDSALLFITLLQEEVAGE